MPRLPRSTSLTFALVFGFLSVLTIFGVSSGGLKADTLVVLAAATPPITPSLQNYGRVWDGVGGPLEDRDGSTRGLKFSESRNRAKHREAEEQRARCQQRCKLDYSDCASATKGSGWKACVPPLRMCLGRCPDPLR